MTAPEVTWKQLEAIRKWWVAGGFLNASTATGLRLVDEAAPAIDAILAANPTPWEPSDEDVEAYCSALGWALSYRRSEAHHALHSARKRGWNLVPRRIEGGVR